MPHNAGLCQTLTRVEESDGMRRCVRAAASHFFFVWRRRLGSYRSKGLLDGREEL